MLLMLQEIVSSFIHSFIDSFVLYYLLFIFFRIIQNHLTNLLCLFFFSFLGSYKPPKNRPGVVRSYVKAIVPIEISDVRVMELTRSSQIISKIIIKQALIEGVKRKIFEPLTEKY